MKEKQSNTTSIQVCLSSITCTLNSCLFKPLESPRDKCWQMKSDLKYTITHMKRRTENMGSHWSFQCVCVSELADWKMSALQGVCCLTACRAVSCHSVLSLPPCLSYTHTQKNTHRNTHIPQGQMSKHIRRLLQTCGLTSICCSALGRLNTPGALQTSAWFLCSKNNLHMDEDHFYFRYSLNNFNSQLSV